MPKHVRTARTVRRSHREAMREARRRFARQVSTENGVLLRLAGMLGSIAREERAADLLRDHDRRMAAWKRLDAVRAEAARAGLVDEVEHLIRSAQRGQVGGPDFRTHGSVLRRWR